MRRDAVLEANRQPQVSAPEWEKGGAGFRLDLAGGEFESTLVALVISGRGAPVTVDVEGGAVPAEALREAPIRERPNSNPPGYVPPAVIVLLAGIFFLSTFQRSAGPSLLGLAGLLAVISLITFGAIYETIRHRHLVLPLLRLRWGSPDLAAPRERVQGSA
jgi:hypothetical protein